MVKIYKNQKSSRAPEMHLTISIKVNKLALVKEKVKGAVFITIDYMPFWGGRGRLHRRSHGKGIKADSISQVLMIRPFV